MEEMPTAETFEALVEQVLRLEDDTPLTLVAVERPTDPARGARVFTLILRGARQPVVAEGLHRLTHQDGESYDLYIMPIHTLGSVHQDYQIVIG